MNCCFSEFLTVASLGLVSFIYLTDTLVSSYHRAINAIFWRKIVIIFLPISLNICFGFSKEPSHRDGSFEYPPHMFWLRNKKNNFLVRTLIWRSCYPLAIIVIYDIYYFRFKDRGGRIMKRKIQNLSEVSIYYNN